MKEKVIDKIEYKIDENSFQEIFDIYFTPLCKFLNLYTKDSGIIEDTIQEIFYNVWVNRDFLKITHIKSYLYTSARNRMLNCIRDEKRNLQILTAYMMEEKVIREAYECIDNNNFDQQLESAIEELPEKCKKVFLLSRYGKMTYKEIAKKEDISEKMVGKHIATALKKIKVKMRKALFFFYIIYTYVFI